MRAWRRSTGQQQAVTAPPVPLSALIEAEDQIRIQFDRNVQWDTPGTLAPTFRAYNGVDQLGTAVDNASPAASVLVRFGVNITTATLIDFSAVTADLRGLPDNVLVDAFTGFPIT